MPDDDYQADLFGGGALNFELPDADVRYWQNFIDQRLASQWHQRLLETLNWRQEKITIFGKQHKVPRLSCWMAEPGLDYSYSNMTMQAVKWSDDVLLIKALVEKKSGLSFNSVLLNYYRDGQDSNGWHADNEPELGENPSIASVSLGGKRDFKLRNIRDNSLKYSIALEHGSLLLMQGKTQTRWQHHIPKRANAQPRINLTFRTIYKEFQVTKSLDQKES